jgi:SAM-dependent methyltransferase
LKRNGIEGFARDFLYAILLKNKTYYNTLGKLGNFSSTTKDIDIREMNAENLLFPDETFDIAVSIATFEHISNVPQAVSELSRVMKKGGVAYILIHLFTSLSGGHHFDWANPSKVLPWDHLRQNKYPVPVYLNKLREHEYLHLFGENFNILEVIDISVGEGKDLLTPEIRDELAHYSEEELLKRGITIVARKGWK